MFFLFFLRPLMAQARVQEATARLFNLPLKAPGYPALSTTTVSDPVRKLIRTEHETGDIVQKSPMSCEEEGIFLPRQGFGIAALPER